MARWRLMDQVVPHLHADKLGGTIKEQDRPHNPGFQHSEKKPQNHWLKTCGGCSGRRNSQPHRRVHWRDPHGPKHKQTHAPRNQHQKGPICLCVVGTVTESGTRAEQVALSPLRPLPHLQQHNTATWVARPLLRNRCAKTKNMAQ